MKVGVIGTGHVGLPTAATLAHIGHDVVAYDTLESKIEQLNRGEMPFFEAQMAELVREGLDAGRISFTGDPATAIKGADVVFICVGTPPRSTGEASLVAVEQAAETCARCADGDLVVVDKSTVPAGTGERVAEVLSHHNTENNFAVVSNPEFLREGTAIYDSLNPSRILVGSSSDRGLEVMKRLYQPLIDRGALFMTTDIATAELAKHASNAFLALKISFANALARICEATGGDVVEVADAMGVDPRIGRAFLNAGLGYGGYCFPKDIAAFERLSSRLGYDFGLLREVARINDETIDAAFTKIERALWNLEGKRVAMLGLSFKPGTDDTRFSPALALAARLIGAGVTVIGYDPEANATASREMPELEVAQDLYSALEQADCVVIATDWPEFADLDLQKAKELMKRPLIVDTRNLLVPAAVAEAGFQYIPMGRPELKPRQ